MKLAAMKKAERPEMVERVTAQPEPLRPRAEKPAWAWSVHVRKEQSAAEDPEDMWDNLPV